MPARPPVFHGVEGGASKGTIMSVQRIENYDNGVRACCMGPMPLLKAAERIVALDVNALAVLDLHGCVVGILTDHDIIRALVKTHNWIDTETVASGMTSPAITCEIDTSLSDALKLMGKNRIRHLAVVREGAFVRMFTLKDLLEQIHRDDTLEVNVLRDLAKGRLGPDA